MDKIRVTVYNSESDKMVCWKEYRLGDIDKAEKEYKELKELEGVYPEWKHMR